MSIPVKNIQRKTEHDREDPRTSLGHPVPKSQGTRSSIESFDNPKEDVPDGEDEEDEEEDLQEDQDVDLAKVTRIDANKRKKNA